MTQRTQPDTNSQLIGCIFAIAMIVFGLWFGATKTIEFAYHVTRDQAAIDAAEMQMLHESMNCEPGETLQITPLGDHGAKSVRCVPAGRMPRG